MPRPLVTPPADDVDPVAVFNCPNRKVCLMREGMRWVATIVIACVASYLTGCVMRMTGPGFTLESQWAPLAAPPASSQPAVP
jgi:hypothetical protein